MKSSRLGRLIIGVLVGSAGLACADVVDAFKNSEPRLMAEGFEFTEGPVISQDGSVLFTVPRQNAIVSYSIGKGIHGFYYQGEHPVSALFYRNGKLFATQGALKRVIRIDSPDEFVSLAASYAGQPFNKPNDLWVSPKGHIYFTDPNYGRQPPSQDGEFAYMVNSGGEVRRIDAEFNRPNGIVGSEDGKTLFITDAGDSRTYRFLLNEEGVPGAPSLFTEIGGDGMTLDQKGNLYIAVPRQKALVVINPEGREIARVSEFGCTNVCFGPEGKVLYITRKPGLWAWEIY